MFTASSKKIETEAQGIWQIELDGGDCKCDHGSLTTKTKQISTKTVIVTEGKRKARREREREIEKGAGRMRGKKHQEKRQSK